MQSIIYKYEEIPLNSLKLENNILDIEKIIIFEEKSQIPDLVEHSKCPFDKNYCYHEIPLTHSIHENIFPKQRYYLKSQQIIEIKPLDINTVFSDNKLLGNKIEPQKENKNEIEDDDNSIQKKIISAIENHHYKIYYPKNIQHLNTNEIDNEWYIIGEHNDGPYNDLAMYYKLYKIYYDSPSEKEKFSNYLINEKRSDIFITMDDCFARLKSKFEYQKNNNNQYANALMAQYMINYRKQFLQNYYQIINNNQLNNKNILKNNTNINTNINNNNNNNNNNKLKSPNKFDNPSQNKELNNNNNYKNNYNYNRGYNYNNRGKKNFYKNLYNNYENYNHNVIQRKEKISEYNRHKNKTNDLNQNKNEKELKEKNKVLKGNNNEIASENINLKEINENIKLIKIDKEELFKEK